MPLCAVYGCNNYTKKTKGLPISYHTFPKNPDLAKQWKIACRRDDIFDITKARICSIHFSESDKQYSPQQKMLNYFPKHARKLKNDAVPSLNLPLLNKHDGQNKRDMRLNKRVSKKLVNELLVTATSTEITANISNLPPSQITEGECSKNVMPPTDNDYLKKIDILQNEIKLWKHKYEVLLEENGKLRAEIETLPKIITEKTESTLAKVFTPGQIRVLVNPNKKRVRWSNEDISDAMSLRSVSPKAYRYLRMKKHYPLPALSTLRKWSLNLNLGQGVLNDVLSLMEHKGRSLTELERLTVLSFDEIYISNKMCLDKKTEQVLGPHKSSQVVMARGLLAQWKQPIFYKFDQNMTKDILSDVITKLFTKGYTVVSITSDMGGSNVGLWSKLNIGPDAKWYFPHPVKTNLNVYVFADVPHLLKLARNHFIDTGFSFEGENTDKTCIETLLSISTGEIKIAHKISQYHLSVNGTQRQNVRPAAQLFSNSLAQCIEWCGLRGLMGESRWQKTAMVLKLFNDWFDLFNARCKFGQHIGTHAFGLNLETQKMLLEKMTSFISNMRVGQRRTLVPFQKGIIVCNKALLGLYEQLQKEYSGIEYLLTFRLNQDILENFFSYLRAMGGANDHPTPLEFKYRLRWYILGKHSSAIFSINRNTLENSEEQCLVTMETLSQSNRDIQASDEDECFTQSMFKGLIKGDAHFEGTYISLEDEIANIPFEEPNTNDLSNYVVDEECLKVLEDFENNLGLTAPEIINEEGLKYIAGYIAHRFRNKYPHLGQVTEENIWSGGGNNLPDWINFISNGRLITPSEDLQMTTKLVNKIFINFHGPSLKFSNESHIFTKVVNEAIKLNTTVSRIR